MTEAAAAASGAAAQSGGGGGGGGGGGLSAVQRLDLVDERFDAPAREQGVVFGGSRYTREEHAAVQRALKQHLSADYVSFRPAPGGGEVAYLEGGRATELANSIFGFNGWSTMIRSLIVDYYNPVRGGKAEVFVTAVVRIILKDGTFHEDVGTGSATGLSKDAAVEKAKKQAVTDAKKRALK